METTKLAKKEIALYERYKKDMKEGAYTRYIHALRKLRGENPIGPIKEYRHRHII